MPLVPWIRFYTSMPRHRKTTVLKRLLGTYEYVVNLWCWAADNAKGGDLTGFTVAELEGFAEWRGAPGVAVAAMVEAGFIDKDADGMRLHRWMERTGAGVDSLLKTRHRQSELMKHRRSVSANDDANTNNNPFPLSSPDPDSEKKEGVSQRVSANIQPDTAHNLIHCLKVAMEAKRPTRGMYSPGPFADRDAGELLRAIGGESAAHEVAKRIALFVADDSMTPWTVARFCKAYNGIGAPKPTRSGQESKTWKVMER